MMENRHFDATPTLDVPQNFAKHGQVILGQSNLPNPEPPRSFAKKAEGMVLYTPSSFEHIILRFAMLVNL